MFIISKFIFFFLIKSIFKKVKKKELNKMSYSHLLDENDLNYKNENSSFDDYFFDCTREIFSPNKLDKDFKINELFFQTQPTEDNTKQINQNTRYQEFNPDINDKDEDQCDDITKKINQIIENQESNAENFASDINDNNVDSNCFENVIEEKKSEIIENINELKKNYKNLGRKKKDFINNTGDSLHSKNAKDNIIRKIKIHILLFIINLINDSIKNEFKRQNYTIRGICKEITSDITIKNNILLFEQKIGDILSNDINKKYKNVESDENKRQIEKIRKAKDKCAKTNELLDKTFDEVYELFIHGDKGILKEKYGLNKADNLNDYLNKISYKESKEYVDEFYNNAISYKTFFDSNRARKQRKKKD
jgi:hypothetical protein